MNGLAEQAGTPGFADLNAGNYAAATDAAYTRRMDNLPLGAAMRGLYPIGTPVQRPPRNPLPK